MALYDSIYGYGADTTGLGLGASNPLGSYMQTATSPSTLSTGITSPTTIAGTAGAGMMSDLNKLNTSYYPETPGNNTNGQTGSNSGLGWNMGTLNLAIQGLGTIGSLWNAWQANSLAKKQYETSKAFANANLANQIQSYNTALEDRSRSRAFTEGQTAEQAQSYIDKNRLQERTI